MDAERANEGGLRKRTSTACEACRSSKLRCLPSAQPGVCKKCLDSKKECVSRTGPRIRRSKKAILAQAQSESSSATSAPQSSTFTIDFALPPEQEIDENFKILRDSHSANVDKLFPESTEPMLSSPSSLSGGAPTPAAVKMNSQSIEGFHAKPQFNRASAESLLESFKSMLIHFPCIALDPTDTVGHLAKTRPFVLLAILSAASGSKTLQGHVLYDEEFRKVLGLKFVAGGERTLELLQGILVYCAWFPFHLRPKNKQVFHYIRMAGDLVHDLELDQETGPCKFEGYPDEKQLDYLRAYLAFQYIATIAVFTPSPFKSALNSTFTTWTLTCCDILDTLSEDHHDRVLTTLLRLAGIIGSSWEAVYERKGQSDQQGRLALLGLETHLQSLKDTMPTSIASLSVVKLAVMSTEIYLAGGVSIIRIQRVPKGFMAPLTPELSKLYPCCQTLKELLEYLVNMDRAVYTRFTCIDWSKFVTNVIIAIRLSFHLPECPGWDDAWARGHMQFEQFLDHVCEDPLPGPPATHTDILSATRVVLDVVKAKYERNVYRINAAAMDVINIGGCPMLDGSLAQMAPVWDPAIAMTPVTMGSPGKTAGGQPVFHDLWATMTMGWAEDGDLEKQISPYGAQ